ncbi:hypothetical protein THI4931_17310 [Pandoraea sputorum]|nr:hypothetical protein THI4931_17310 [Pandoraea sputorum]
MDHSLAVTLHDRREVRGLAATGAGLRARLGGGANGLTGIGECRVQEQSGGECGAKNAASKVAVLVGEETADVAHGAWNCEVMSCQAGILEGVP